MEGTKEGNLISEREESFEDDISGVEGRNMEQGEWELDPILGELACGQSCICPQQA